ncbi:glycophorin-C [Xyrauchen texanus]|uniref:glycophorin-C n=1 Tax=Xyrauchen texanus TaxID=154827 RepID=UPI00224208B7|nr:glycophorin-C [Xyrauchen texanus]
MDNFTDVPTLGPVDTTSKIHKRTSNNDTYMAREMFESVDGILLGVSVVAVVVVLLLLLVVVLRYIAHQKGTYNTHEEALALKSDPEVQEVQNVPEESEEEEQ